MSNLDVDTLFGWLKEKQNYHNDTQSTLKNLQTESSLIAEEMNILENLIETPFDVGNIVEQAIMNTQAYHLVKVGKERGFVPTFSPKQVHHYDIDDQLQYGILSCSICFERPGKVNEEVAEKIVDLSTRWLKTDAHICNLGQAKKARFQKWMLPIIYVQEGPIHSCKGGDEKVFLADYLDEGFLKNIKRLGGDYKAEMKLARHHVIDSMEIVNWFRMSFDLTSDGSVIRFTYPDKREPGFNMTSLYGHAVQPDVHLLTDLDDQYKEATLLSGEIKDIIGPVGEIIDCYKEVCDELNEGGKYFFSRNIEVELESQ